MQPGSEKAARGWDVLGYAVDRLRKARDLQQWGGYDACNNQKEERRIYERLVTKFRQALRGCRLDRQEPAWTLKSLRESRATEDYEAAQHEKGTKKAAQSL